MGRFSAGIAFAAFFLLIAGCASAPPLVQPKPAAPIVQIAPGTWRMVDADIWIASYNAKAEADSYARSALNHWMERVRKRTEEDFIPWYTSFGTQQWLSLKVGWYELNEQEGQATPAEQLAAYLQEQYYERVLQPISPQIDPRKIMERTAALYVGSLGAEIRALPGRYGLPLDAFRDHLKAIPAIYVYTVPNQRASLYQLIEEENPTDLPAYVALLARVRPDEEGIGSELSRNQFYPVAKASADKLVGQLAMRGGASAAGLAVGGVPGILISIGVSGWQAMEHEKDKPALEAELRSNLSTALDGIRYYLSEDPQGGVTAPVVHMSDQIENGLVGVQNRGSELDGGAETANPGDPLRLTQPGGAGLPRLF